MRKLSKVVILVNREILDFDKKEDPLCQIYKKTQTFIDGFMKVLKPKFHDFLKFI